MNGTSFAEETCCNSQQVFVDSESVIQRLSLDLWHMAFFEY